MAKRKCETCKAIIRDIDDYGGLCWPCYLSSCLPAWYAKAEKYSRGQDGILLAGCVPKTGNALLDSGAPVRSQDLGLSDSELIAMRAREKRMGTSSLD